MIYISQQDLHPSGTAKYFTSANVKENLGCSYNTASSVLNGLVELGVFSKQKKGREWLFYMLDKGKIQNNWQSLVLISVGITVIGLSIFFRMHTKLSKQEIQQRVRQSLEMVDLHDVENLRPEELSGGMLKRAAIARATVIQPRYLLYDEPTTGLDPKACQTINNLIIRMQKKLEITSVVVTHDIHSAVKVSDRIAMLHHGKIVAIEKSAQIYQSNNEVINDFLKGEIF